MRVASLLGSVVPLPVKSCVLSGPVWLLLLLVALREEMNAAVAQRADLPGAGAEAGGIQVCGSEGGRAG